MRKAANMFRPLIMAIMVISTVSTSSRAEAIDVTADLDGVPYRIQVPEGWGGGLVMYAHGYQMRGRPWRPMPEVVAQVYLDRGFALAQSGYSRQGWALEEAVPQTEALRRHFVAEYGRPKQTFITGHSMGGLITLATIEQYPDAYDGAMPMCGPLTPALFFFKDRVFDMLVTYDALFGEALPEEYRPLMEAAILPGPVVQQAFASRPEMHTKFAHQYGMREADVARIIAMNHMLYKELEDRAGGNPFDNRETVYMGFEGLPGLNRMVKRYAADPAAVDYIRKYYTVTGDIADPVLAVHTTYDPGVPACVPCYYDKLSVLNDKEDMFVQMYVEAEGHCNFTPEQTGKAFDLLREWVDGGETPEAGRIE